MGYRDSEGDWLIQHRHYSPFGKLVKTDGSDYGLLSASSHIWAGHHQDLTTGLYYMQARWMDPDSGRFMSQDPMGFAAGDTNLYRYAGNSPTNFVDPTGQAIPLIPLMVYLATAGTTGLYIANYERDQALEAGRDSLGMIHYDNIDHARYNRANWIGAVSEVTAKTGLAGMTGFAAAPVLAPVFGVVAVLSTTAATTIGIAATSYWGYSVYDETRSLINDWDHLSGSEKFRRTGLLVGPNIAGIFGGVKGMSTELARDGLLKGTLWAD